MLLEDYFRLEYLLAEELLHLMLSEELVELELVAVAVVDLLED